MRDQRLTLVGFRRLARLDAMLASKGVRVSAAAEAFGVSAKTIRRDLDFLAELSPMSITEGEWLWRYDRPERRVFNPVLKLR